MGLEMHAGVFYSLFFILLTVIYKGYAYDTTTAAPRPPTPSSLLHDCHMTGDDQPDDHKTRTRAQMMKQCFVICAPCRSFLFFYCSTSIYYSKYVQQAASPLKRAQMTHTVLWALLFFLTQALKYIINKYINNTKTFKLKKISLADLQVLPTTCIPLAGTIWQKFSFATTVD